MHVPCIKGHLRTLNATVVFLARMENLKTRIRKRMRFTALVFWIALDLSQGISLQCAGTSFAGSTDCDKQKGCVVLKTFSTNSSDACCASCFSTPACDSWTLCGGDGMCRIKKNGVANPQKGSSSSLRRSLQRPSAAGISVLGAGPSPIEHGSPRCTESPGPPPRQLVESIWCPTCLPPR